MHSTKGVRSVLFLSFDANVQPVSLTREMPTFDQRLKVAMMEPRLSGAHGARLLFYKFRMWKTFLVSYSLTNITLRYVYFCFVKLSPFFSNQANVILIRKKKDKEEVKEFNGGTDMQRKRV